MAWRTEETRVGLIGLYASGKTAFLTSLINHLEHHDPQEFKLDSLGQVRVSQFHYQSPGNGYQPRNGWTPFNYRWSRNGLVKGEFPDKTQKPMEAVCRFVRDDYRFHDCRLRMFDFPGERLTDLVIAGKSYADWSEHVLFQLEGDGIDHASLQAYRKASASQHAEEEEILHQYKRILGQQIGNYSPYIVPSTFLLDLEGKPSPPGTPEDMAKRGLSGQPGAEFAPLSNQAALANPALFKRFQQHYKAYRKTVVWPIFSELVRCHSLVVLVDVLSILAGGPKMYNGTLAMLTDLLKALDPKNSLMRKMVDVLRKSPTVFLPAGWRPGGIKKVAFVAPMCDRAGSQIDRDNMKALLRGMLERVAYDLPGIPHCFETCSAVCSTAIINPQQRELRASFSDNGQTTYTVPAVPAQWPLTWRGEDFSFPFPNPDVAPVMNHKPKHIHLDDVFRFAVN